jgi:hypothetical protein
MLAVSLRCGNLFTGLDLSRLQRPRPSSRRSRSASRSRNRSSRVRVRGLVRIVPRGRSPAGRTTLLHLSCRPTSLSGSCVPLLQPDVLCACNSTLACPVTPDVSLHCVQRFCVMKGSCNGRATRAEKAHVQRVQRRATPVQRGCNVRFALAVAGSATRATGPYIGPVPLHAHTAAASRCTLQAHREVVRSLMRVPSWAMQLAVIRLLLAVRNPARLRRRASASSSGSAASSSPLR